MARRRGRQQHSPPGRLRIVAGKWRSRLLDVADVPGLRPTSERIRETLFNWLAPVIDGARCLDLFAGTGALGFEALSRGAAEVVFVEVSRPAVAALEKARSELGADGAIVHRMDASDYVRSADHTGRFDIVFLDPPYADDSVADLCRLLDVSDRLARGAIVYFEQGREQAAPALPDGWVVTHEKTAGQVRYSLARVGASD